MLSELIFIFFIYSSLSCLMVYVIYVISKKFIFEVRQSINIIIDKLTQIELNISSSFPETLKTNFEQNKKEEKEKTKRSKK